MFGPNRDREATFVVGGKRLNELPDQRATIKLAHVDSSGIAERGGPFYIQRMELEGLDMQHTERYGLHQAELRLVPPSTIAVATFEDRCHSCKSLNGRSFEGDQVNQSPLKTYVQWKK